MSIVVSTVVQAPISEVWRAYTTPEDIKLWNAASPDWHTTSAARQPAEEIAKDMFNASWIGNVWKTADGTDRFSFKHRKRNAAFNRKHGLIVHNGLWKALNLV
jgi:uncharacterized protein YndB with AHSA1/START domain